MLGLPVWFWVVAVIVAVPVLAIWLFVSRFRKMCRTVRGDIGQFLREKHPEFEVIGERQGNLVVRDKEGAERVWEMADVYATVARLPGMGADPAARAGVYAQAVILLLNPAPDRSQPLSLATHGDRIKLELMTTESCQQSAPASEAPHTPIPGLADLAAVYVLDLPDGGCYVSENDRGILGIDVAEMHRLALANLRKNFPQELVGDVKAGGDPAAIQFQDSFNAARLLLVPELLEGDEELIALVPHRDMLVLLPATMREDPEKLQQSLETLKCDGHRPVLNRPVRVTRNGFELI